MTITIRPYKTLLNLDEKKTIYKKATQLEQHMFVDSSTAKMFNGCPYTLVSEEHKNGNLHYHGMILCSSMQRDIFNEQLKSYFGRCEIKFLITHVDAIKWNKYIHKENGMIIEVGYNGVPWNELYNKNIRARPL